MSNKRQINDREDALADTQRAIIEAAERRGYERAREELAERNEALLRQALETLEELQHAVVSAASTEEVSMYYRTIAALSAALAKPQSTAEHISSPECWCHPELDYKDQETGAEVWVHRGLQ